MITHVSPVGAMDLLSQLEVDRLKDTAKLTCTGFTVTAPSRF